MLVFAFISFLPRLLDRHAFAVDISFGSNVVFSIMVPSIKPTGNLVSFQFNQTCNVNYIYIHRSFE